MPNKKINALDVKVAVSTDLMLVGDPATGTAYKSTLSTLPLVPYTGASGSVNLGEFGLATGQVTFDQTPTGTAGVGVMRWNDTDGTVDLGLKGGNVTLQVGQEQVLRVVNKTGADLLESQYRAVRIRLVSEGGAQGQRLAVVLAQGNNDPDSTTTIGIVTETITNNQEGFITTSGEVRGINTTGSLQGETWADGDILYLSPTIAGAITKVKPTAPNHSLTLGYVVYAHAVNGKIFVKVDNGYEIGELHDVYVPTPSNNDGIFWNTANLRYQNNSISGILGYTPQAALTLTTTGTSGAATLVGATLNIPQYSGTNIYNADGTLTGNRTVTMGAFDLVLTGNSIPTLEINSTGNSVSTDYSVLKLSTTAKTWTIATGGTTTSFNGIFYIDSPTSSTAPFKINPDGTTNLLNTTIDNLSSVSNLTINNAIASNYSVLTLKNSGASGKTYQIAVGGSGAASGLANNLYFADSVNGARMVLTNAGRLLLGTTTESTYLLDVNGTARVSYSAAGTGIGFQIYNTGSANSIIKILGNSKILIGNSTFEAPELYNISTSASTQVLNGSNIAFNSPSSSAQTGTSGFFSISGISIDNLGSGNFNNISSQRGFAPPSGTATFANLYLESIINQTGTASGISRGIWLNPTLTSAVDWRGVEIVTGSDITYIGRNTGSASVRIDSTTKGFLPPRMTTTERNAIATPAVGLIVYCTDSVEGVYVYTSLGWKSLTMV